MKSEVLVFLNRRLMWRIFSWALEMDHSLVCKDWSSVWWLLEPHFIWKAMGNISLLPFERICNWEGRIRSKPNLGKVLILRRGAWNRVFLDILLAQEIAYENRIRFYVDVVQYLNLW
jgi:hypothetical protein